MTRLILTTDVSAAGNLGAAYSADMVISLDPRFVGGPLPSDAELEALLAPRTTQKQGEHWHDHAGLRQLQRLEKINGASLGLIELCTKFATVEMWIGPAPQEQLKLVWLLDYLRSHNEIISKLALVQSDLPIGSHEPQHVLQWQLPVVPIRGVHLELASAAWRAYRATTPQDCFGLMTADLALLPGLRQAVLELLGELPGRASGVGATEMRMLKLISEGKSSPSDIFTDLLKPAARRVYGYWELGELLDGLVRSQAPAVSGLREGPFTLEMHNDRERRGRYGRSRLSLTALGEAILAEADDFSRHNPIQRWWGGTRLTNDRLWRWDRERRALITP